jgi:hypothetical protein
VSLSAFCLSCLDLWQGHARLTTGQFSAVVIGCSVALVAETALFVYTAFISQVDTLLCVLILLVR